MISYLDVFAKHFFYSQFVSLETWREIMKRFSNEKVSGKVWNILAKVRRETSLFILSSITAHRGYNIPCNFSDRTMRVKEAAEFIRRDIS